MSSSLTTNSDARRTFPGLSARKLPDLWKKTREGLGKPIPPYAIAVFRILFGVLLVYDVLRYISKGWITSKYVNPDFFFPYEGFEFLSPLPEPWIHVAWACVGLFAFLILIGAFYRLAMAGFILGYGYFFLLDKAQYMNHHYMVLLFAILLLFIPAHSVWSVDARWKAVPPTRQIHKVLLAFQIEIILVTAGLVKISHDWLHLAPLKNWLLRRQDEVFYGSLFQFDWVIALASYGTIALHVIGAPLLLFKRTRIWVFLAYCLFHICNAQLFRIGIFPLLTIAATTIVFASDWPLKFLKVTPSASAVKSAGAPVTQIGMLALCFWVATQTFLPWRNVLYDTEVRWTGQGHKFSWRMKIYDRESHGHFTVRDNESGNEWIINPDIYLTSRQVRKMWVRPDMIVQIAHHIEDKWVEKGFSDLSVYAAVSKSLNGRPFETYVDPSQDLTRVPSGFFAKTDILLAPGPQEPLL